ncbi:hypothetical protein, partial [Epilithonimonas sp.]|uniref:hypothetical protein n=1 Tax=Epilithonimonas sp. TaxID=2894511 RepID=UPI00289DACAC
FLIREKLIAPEQEIVFVPSGGVKGVPGVVSMISSKADDIPFLIIDSDKSGEDAKKKLLSGLYQGLENRILDVKEFTEIEKSEVEDLIPFSLIKKGVDRLFNSLDEVDFEDNYNKEIPVVSQIETFAKANGIVLEKGWKVGISMTAKAQLKNKKSDDIPKEYVDKWTKLFNAFLSA